ncbi:MAG: metal ABC transporter permease, partial [Gemmataceae bacterium]
PNVAARFWTDRLGVMVALASVFGVLMGVTGTWISATFDHMPAGPTIVLVGSAVFVVSLLLAPRRGLLARWLARRAFDQTLRQRKLLRVLYELSEPSVPPPMPLSFRDILRARSWTAPQLRRWLARLERLGWLRRVGADGYALTPDGLRRAADLVRGQRLWELYRTEYPELASGTAELTDEALEKVLPAPILADLTAKLRTSGRMPM